MGMKDRVRNRFLRKVAASFTVESETPLERGLSRLSSRIGLHDHHSTPRNPRHQSSCCVIRTQDCARTVFYAPNMDGHVDPGEVVWFWSPECDADNHPKERSIVVVGRHNDHILGLITSPNEAHREESDWLDIGTGPWNDQGRQSWVRLDKIISVPESDIRRSGAVIPNRRFERIAQRLRSDFGWA